jgi:hypothetical protein
MHNFVPEGRFACALCKARIFTGSARVHRHLKGVHQVEPLPEHILVGPVFFDSPSAPEISENHTGAAAGAYAQAHHHPANAHQHHNFFSPSPNFSQPQTLQQLQQPQQGHHLPPSLDQPLSHLPRHILPRAAKTGSDHDHLSAAAVGNYYPSVSLPASAPVPGGVAAGSSSLDGMPQVMLPVTLLMSVNAPGASIGP